MEGFLIAVVGFGIILITLVVIGWVIDFIECKRVKAEMEANIAYQIAIEQREKVFEENIKLQNENQKLRNENIWLKNHQEIKITNLKED